MDTKPRFSIYWLFAASALFFTLGWLFSPEPPADYEVTVSDRIVGATLTRPSSRGTSLSKRRARLGRCYRPQTHTRSRKRRKNYGNELFTSLMPNGKQFAGKPSTKNGNTPTWSEK